MSHDHGHSKENKTIISFKNAFWLVIIIVLLFVAALNFVNAESGSEEGKEKTEMNATEHQEKATENKAEEPKAEAPKPTENAAATDTAKAH